MQEGMQENVLPVQFRENLVEKRENTNAEKCPDALKSEVRAYQNFIITN